MAGWVWGLRVASENEGGQNGKKEAFHAWYRRGPDKNPVKQIYPIFANDETEVSITTPFPWLTQVQWPFRP